MYLRNNCSDEVRNQSFTFTEIIDFYCHIKSISNITINDIYDVFHKL